MLNCLSVDVRTFVRGAAFDFPLIALSSGDIRNFRHRGTNPTPELELLRRLDHTRRNN